MKANNKQKDKTIAELSERLEDTISHSRRLNIIINGVAEKSDEDIAKVIKDIFVRKMQIPEDVVDKFRFRDFHRIGAIGKQTGDGYIVKKDNKKPSNNQDPHRAIIIAFTQQMNRNLVFTYAKNLAGAGISVKPDLSQALSKLRTKLLGIRKDIKNINSENLAVLTYRSYKPCLLVNYEGEKMVYTDDMDINLCR